MNVCVFKGNLTRDPEVRSVGDTKVASFSLAVNERPYKKDGELVKNVSFFDFDIWAGGAEVFEKYLHKGDPVLVRATAKQDTWEDKETGQKRSKVKFRVDDFEFLSRGNGNGNADSETGEVTEKSEPVKKRGRPKKVETVDESVVDGDSIPF
jgi:single-strand DNA-binding protein